jgi:sterol desaturase/sphingolipid hydroxylase (fatty acid hydroxylase superfamily)
MLAEHLVPRRALSVPRSRRWLANLSLSVINTLALKLLLPGSLAAVAVWANNQHYGFLSVWSIPDIATFLIGLVLLDLLIYWQHRVFHAVPCLWRLHKVHHSDIDIDVTTAVRFHPVEIVMSAIIKLFAILAIGISAETIIVFEIILSGCALFNHSNLRLPPTLDQWLRLVIVTPDMHRVHHSIHAEETNSNYGFNLAWWDRLFNTYKPQPQDGHSAMAIGLRSYRTPLALFELLCLPFRRH